MKSVEIIQKSQEEARRLGMLLLANEDGKLLLRTLERLFYEGSLADKDPNQTYLNLGRRDVVMFLQSLRDQAQKEK